MTDFLDADIQNALCSQLNAGSFSQSIAWPYIPFTPVEDQAYIQVHPIMKARTRHPGLQYSDSNINTGLFQVDAVIPDGQGEAPGLQLAAQIAERFAIGTTLLAGTRKLQINDPPQTTQGMKDGAWVRFPVTITYIITGV